MSTIKAMKLLSKTHRLTTLNLSQTRQITSHITNVQTQSRIQPNPPQPHSAEPTNPQASRQPKTYFRIKLIRSAIGLPARTAAALKVLGLQKRMRTVFHPVSADVAGQIFKVKELVAVKEVGESEVKTRRELVEERRPHPGFWVERVAGGRGGDGVGVAGR